LYLYIIKFKKKAAMKKSVVYLIAIFLITTVFPLHPATGQDKSKEEQEKEIKIQQAIEEQKKAMSDHQRAQEDAVQNMQEAQDEMEKIQKDINVVVDVEAADKADKAVRAHVKRINRSSGWEEPYLFAPGEPFFVHAFDGDEESTSWDFSRKVKDKTLKSDYTFDVEKTATSVVMSVRGDCKEGEIRIKIVMPGGKTYSDIVIDEFGNLNWRKSFTISETENQDKAGAWKFLISSNKATGYFNISLQTY
jgi:hypothetical protein